jgi:ubiquitin-conjugating enzyme (huntingtin interacting protein 2)
MLLRTPKEFERVAREWAVVYAGAPMGDDNGSGPNVDESPLGANPDSLAK